MQVLLYHTLGPKVLSTDLSDGLTAPTLNGENIVINLNPPTINGNSEILVDEGLVDILASNGKDYFVCTWYQADLAENTGTFI